MSYQLVMAETRPIKKQKTSESTTFTPIQNNMDYISSHPSSIISSEKEIIEEAYYLGDEEVREIICWGCIDDEPGQLAHMDYGGCLYME